MKSGLNQYAPMNGIFTLRNNISNAFLNNYNMQWNPDTEITITAGATEALYSTITALVNPGDEVMMFEPYYDAHQADVILAGGIPTYVTLRKPDFSFDPEDLEETVSNKTKIRNARSNYHDFVNRQNIWYDRMENWIRYSLP
jgi:methionine aminotransferase